MRRFGTPRGCIPAWTEQAVAVCSFLDTLTPLPTPVLVPRVLAAAQPRPRAQGSPRYPPSCRSLRHPRPPCIRQCEIRSTLACVSIAISHRRPSPTFPFSSRHHHDLYADACLQKLTEEEQKLFRLYGKLPTHKNVLTKMQKVPSLCTRCSNNAHIHSTQDRKYFDSGDYALSKAGKAPQNTVGTAIPNPEK